MILFLDIENTEEEMVNAIKDALKQTDYKE